MSKIKVLIIDDELEFASTLSERLALRGFDAMHAESAEEAISLISEGWPPDVALLDLKMPGIDGLKTLEMLKENDPAICVIMITGHGSTASGIEGMKRGLCDYMMKPVDIADLVAKINECQNIV